ncbi:MAG: sensor histidine kinase, partial [Verrucomicrobiota bacterium]
IGNAIVHGSSETPIEVCIDAREDAAVLAVKNHGPVIPPEQIAWLFQPFTQGTHGDSEQARPRGLGLGLFIVQEIVSAHGGTISVQSDREQGTTFSIHLPCRRD